METLEEMLERYRDMKVETAFALEQMKTLEKRIKEYVRHTGEVAEVDGASIKIVKPKKPRVYWDTKALEGFAAAHPELLALRSERWSEPSIRIVVQ